MIVRDRTQTSSKLTAEMSGQVNDALEARYIAEYFLYIKDQFVKSVLDKFRDSKDLTLVVGQSMHTVNGSLTAKERSNSTVSWSRIRERVKSGEITAEQLLDCVKSFDDDKINALIPQSIVPLPPSTYIELRDSPLLTTTMRARHPQLVDFWTELRKRMGSKS